ncbi:MAG: type II toxin-antitoxin system VapC family toxin [Lentisphaerae bacterium]|nr:type II toxin-antitoxin system VapC family toxin [Lentisphaerota bacterium]
MLLLDTHVFVWLASDARELSNRAKQAIEEECDSLFISGITGLEIALAAKRGRLILPVDAEMFIRRAVLQHGVRQIPVTAEIGCLAAALPDKHNDPFDRLIIASATRHGMKVVSKDGTFPKYPAIEVIW